MAEERILIIEDDTDLAALMALYLRDAHFQIEHAITGSAGLHLAATWQPHLIVLDVMLPEIDGWEVCRQIRHTQRIPIIMVTSLGDEDERLHGFAEGVDDYVVKPFLPRELVARVQVHLRRAQEPPVVMGRASIAHAGLRLDRDLFRCYCDGTAIDLTPKEFEVLWILMAQPARTFPRAMLLDLVWGVDAGDAHTLEVHVSRLREKLGRYKDWIKTVWGVGYVFKVTQ